jgi:beta-lactam-binding protein with PASTA domain
MPDLTGLMAQTAQAELTKVGIQSAPLKLVDEPIESIGSGDAPPKPPVRPGAVLSQIPAPGSRVDQTTLVKLTVAK